DVGGGVVTVDLGAADGVRGARGAEHDLLAPPPLPDRAGETGRNHPNAGLARVFGLRRSPEGAVTVVSAAPVRPARTSSRARADRYGLGAHLVSSTSLK